MMSASKAILRFIDYYIIPLLGRLFVSKNKFCNVIYYHDIVDGEGSKYMRTNIEVFRQQIQYLVDNNYETVRFDDFRNSEKMQFNNKRILIAFDDGWRSNYEKIFRMMKENGLKYNVFLTVGKIERDPNFLTWDMVREMYASGICGFGVHTLTHHSMADLSKINISEEVDGANMIFERELGYPPLDFCYPFGYYTEESNIYLEKFTKYERIYTSKMFYSYFQDGKVIFGRNAISNSYPMHYYVKKLNGWTNIHTLYSKYVICPLLNIYHIISHHKESMIKNKLP